MLKFTYVLTSARNDYYPEQAYVSMYSLRKHHPEAHITLVADPATLDSLKGRRARVMELVSEVVSADVPSELTPVQKNRFLKTSLRKLVKGDLMYLDNDTVVMGDLSGLENQPGDFLAVLDHHKKLELKDYPQLSQYLNKTKKTLWDYPLYFNGGVWLARDTEKTHSFFETWHNLWNEERVNFGINIDQPSFAQANIENGCMIEEMEPGYNCQIFLPEAKPYLFDTKIAHYFSNSENSTLYPLNREDVLKEVRAGGITEKIKEVVNNPVTAYLNVSLILSGDELQKDYYAPFAILSRKLARTFPFLNSWARLIYRLFGYKI